jgi:hypothetical protein
MNISQNKEAVLSLYVEAVEARYPGKGQVARSIMEQGWDSEADLFCDPARLAAMGYKVDNQFAMNCIKGIATRHPELNQKLKAAK